VIQGKFGGLQVIARFGVFAFDSDQRTLTGDAGEIHLTPKAFDLLALLLAEAPRVVRKRELHERLWPGTFVSDATLVGLVKELRRAFGDHGAETPIIRTAHGVGYAFSASWERAGARSPRISRWIVSGGRRIVLHDGENFIGRDPASEIWLDVPGVSRRHARMVVGLDGVVLEDLGSKNGTSVGGKSIDERVALHDGDRIQVGPILIIYHASATGISTETVASRAPRQRPKA
jgi:DNA-binding winged helix-turn-helix (wHTH) protein